MINSASLRDINANRPVVLNSYDDAVTLVRVMLEDAGVLRSPEAETPADKEVTVPIAREILTAKGYRVLSHRNLLKVLAENGITATKRGNDLWFDAAAVHKVPRKN